MNLLTRLGQFFLIKYSIISTYKPVVLYHGLGDHSKSANLLKIKKTLEESLPGIFVYSIVIGKNQIDERLRSYFDNIDLQVNVFDKIF